MEFDNPVFEQREDGVQEEDTWETTSDSPAWAYGDDVPAGVPKENLASPLATRNLVDRWQRERGKVGANSKFASSVGGELWLRWGRRWLLLTNKNVTRGHNVVLFLLLNR